MCHKPQQQPPQALDNVIADLSAAESAASGKKKHRKPFDPQDSSAKARAPPARKHHHQHFRKHSNRMPLDDACDLTSRLISGLTHHEYECMICCEIIKRHQPTWHCSTSCWAVFHLACIKRWAKNGVNHQCGEWRCPGCQASNAQVPGAYLCFCGKQANPHVNHYLTPHSCESLCGRERDCPHACTLPCHPGPCPPCHAMALPMDCYCGKQTVQVKCSDNPYKGISCGQVCGRVLNCSKHQCEQPCHPGPCGDCTVVETQTCYCGKDTRVTHCGDGVPKWTVVGGQESFGYFECASPCGRALECGHHTCTKGCHPQDFQAGTCDLSPSVVARCPCGKRSVTELIQGERGSCMDPVPTCGAPCAKRLACGHKCASACHTGACPPCNERIRTKCSCGSCTVDITCGFKDTEAKCERPCNQKKNCGKHRCSNRCCKDEHFCTFLCNKKLRCGVHSCPLLCHKGYCPPCLEATFHEVECHCGRTRLFPPIACGVKLPPCPHPCKRVRPCGHAQSTHNCHPDDEACPVCTHFVERACLCGKSVMANVPCHKTVVICGAICNKPLSCGGHLCNRVCHDGPCLVDGQACAQTCDKFLACGHKCKQKCHVPELCPDACQEAVDVTCECGLQAGKAKCTDKHSPLACTAACEQEKRNKTLREALGIERETAAPATVEYGEYLQEFHQLDAAFVKKIEGLLADFVQQDKSMQHLSPMKRHQREFVHHLCEHYRIRTKSVDEEPHRSVILYKTPETQAPHMLLSQSHAPMSAQLACLSTSRPPLNAIHLRHLEFGTTDDQLHEVLQACGIVQYAHTWIADDEVLLMFPNAQECTVKQMYHGLSHHVKHASCCHVNDQGQIEWPKAKKVLPRQVAQQIAVDLAKNNTLLINSFAVLTGE